MHFYLFTHTRHIRSGRSIVYLLSASRIYVAWLCADRAAPAAGVRQLATY